MAAALVIIGLAVFLLVRNAPSASPQLYFVLRVVLSSSAALLGATIPGCLGFLDLRWSGSGLAVRAGGALALFVLTFVYTPDVLANRSTIVDTLGGVTAGRDNINLQDAPSVADFQILLTTCAAGADIKLDDKIKGSIVGIYEKARSAEARQLSFSSATQFLQLLPVDQRLEGYKIYTSCIASFLSGSKDVGSDTTPAVPSSPEASPPPGGMGPPDLTAELEQQLHSASLAFNRPERLRFREAATIELVLAPEELGVEASTLLTPGLPGTLTPGLPGTLRRAASSYALRMQATVSASDFEVTPTGPQERTVLGNRETRWSWTIRPIAFGPDKPVTLEVFALLESDGRTLPPISVRTFHETFLVEVGWWDRAASAAKDIGAFHASLAGIGGTVTAVGLWFWRRRQGEAKRSSKRSATARQENASPAGSSRTVKHVKVFISYRHADTRALKDLRTSLGWLENSSEVTVFDDRQILAGDDWDQVIRRELRDADIIILIVTAGLMASPYCTRVELRQALERRASDGTRIIPIIAEHCDWQSLPIAEIAALPKDEENDVKPLNKWRSNRDVALTQIAQHVRRNVEKLVTEDSFRSASVVYPHATP